MKNIITTFVAFVTLLSANAQTKQPELQVVAQLPIRPGNVAVSKTGRVFATIHALGSSNIQLIEVKSPTAYISYPDASFQKNGNPASDAALDAPLGITFDKNDKLWVIDMGQTLGKTRIWNFDITTNTLIQKIELSEAIAPKGSFIQDIAVDEGNRWAYLADIANPGIIAVNLETKEARRFSGYPALQSEDIDMVIDGKVTYFGGSPARVAINPITLSADRQTLYFGAMNGTTWYSVPAKLFREGATDTAIGAAIKAVGPKPITDGVATDSKGNHYYTDLTKHAISALTAQGEFKTLLTDARLLWPDNVAVANGYVYISVNQLNTTPAFTGSTDQGKAPYYIYRFKNPLK
jgi:sugar lactone lactonase YvrE